MFRVFSRVIRELLRVVFFALPIYSVVWVIAKISHSTTLNALFLKQPPLSVLVILMAGLVLLVLNLLIVCVDNNTFKQKRYSRRAPKELWLSTRCLRVICPWAFALHFMRVLVSKKVRQNQRPQLRPAP
jgi:hypothetical protein